MKRAFKTLFIVSALMTLGIGPLAIIGYFPIACAMLLLTLVGLFGWLIAMNMEDPYKVASDRAKLMPRDPDLKIVVGTNDNNKRS